MSWNCPKCGPSEQAGWRAEPDIDTGIPAWSKPLCIRCGGPVTGGEVVGRAYVQRDGPRCGCGRSAVPTEGV